MRRQVQRFGELRDQTPLIQHLLAQTKGSQEVRIVAFDQGHIVRAELSRVKGPRDAQGGGRVAADGEADHHHRMRPMRSHVVIVVFGANEFVLGQQVFVGEDFRRPLTGERGGVLDDIERIAGREMIDEIRLPLGVDAHRGVFEPRARTVGETHLREPGRRSGDEVGQMLHGGGPLVRIDGRGVDFVEKGIVLEIGHSRGSWTQKLRLNQGLCFRSYVYGAVAGSHAPPASAIAPVDGCL